MFMVQGCVINNQQSLIKDPRLRNIEKTSGLEKTMKSMKESDRQENDARTLTKHSYPQCEGKIKMLMEYNCLK